MHGTCLLVTLILRHLNDYYIQIPFQKLKRIMDTSEHGIIYVSWGSMIRAETLPEEKREGLLKAFGSFKQTVLWKWENETLPNQPANVHIYKWMPQREILCHPKVRVFLTHGGLLGSSEAAYCGVPVVSISFDWIVGCELILCFLIDV